MKEGLKESRIGEEEKIVRELKKKKEIEKAPQFLLNWDEENYDIPAFLRQKVEH